MKKVTILGQGPAGISAAIYTARSGHEAAVIAMGNGALEKAHLIENYYGFPKPISGIELERRGIEQAKNLGVKFFQEEATSLDYDGTFTVLTTKHSMNSDALILASGAMRKTPPIKGLKELEGSGVSYCAVCDGFFYKDGDVAVLGSGEYALHEAKILLPMVSSVTLLTNGKELGGSVPEELIVEKEEIASIQGNNSVEGVEFKNGKFKAFSGIFVAHGIAGSSDLARKIGAVVNGGKIMVNSDMSTNIPGLYAAGDCTGGQNGLLAVSTAVAQGSIAAMSAIKFLSNKE